MKSKISMTFTAQTDERSYTRNYTSHAKATDLTFTSQSKMQIDKHSVTGLDLGYGVKEDMSFTQVALLQVASTSTTSFCHTLPGSSDKHVEVIRIYRRAETVIT